MGYAIVDTNSIYSGSFSAWDNPPRPLLDGESVVECEWDAELDRPIGVTMPLDRTVKRAALKQAWDNHPGVSITLADDSTHLIPIQAQAVTTNRLEVLVATMEQRAATVFTTSGSPVVVPLAELATVAATVATLIQGRLTAYYTAEALIAAATTQAEIDAVSTEL